MMDQKKNDWLAALFFQPDKSVPELINLGITPDNSSVKDREYYKGIPEIQEAFKNDRGEFDNQKFDTYYKDVLDLYNRADEAKLASTAMDSFNYDPADYFAPLGGDVLDVSSRLVKFSNPERRSRGIVNLYETSGPTMSIREVAQTNKIFNYDTGKFEDWTPNEWGGLGAITRPTLVLAQWDEDGTHEVNGRTVSHKAGDLKFNSEGDPFYETLGNRPLTGKDILHISDTLTVDGSKWNKYDFFDSDGLDKSVGGTLAKVLFKVGPMLIPYVGQVYGGMTAAIEIGKLFPVLFRSIEGIAKGDLTNSKSAQTATDIQAWLSRFDGSVSDYGRNSFWNVENIGKLVEDSSRQLFQQRVIGQIPKWIVGKENVSENTIKWGRALSLAYMAGTSSTDAYDAFKQAGASDRVAGLGMLSVMGAMFALMNNDYFKDFWFKDTYLDRTSVKGVIKDVAEKVTNENINKGVVSPKAAANWVIKTKNQIQQRISKMKPGDILYDSFNEGSEEVMEEFSSDMVKGFYSALNALGIIDEDKQLDFGISTEEAFARYTSAFMGGAIGGAVFSLHEKWDSRINSINDEAIQKPNDSLQEIIYLIRNGKTSDLKRELTRLRDKGALGSRNLSGKSFELVKEPDGYKINYESAKEGESQNDVIYNQINSYIDRIDSIINEEGLNISDEELQALSAMTGINVTENLAKNIQRESLKNQLIETGVYSKIFSDWNDLTEDILKTKVALESKITPTELEPKTPKDVDNKIAAAQNDVEFQRLKAKLDDLRAKRDKIVSGELNDYYFGQARFAATPALATAFVDDLGIHNFTKVRYQKDFDQLTSDEKVVIKEEYEKYSKSTEKTKVFAAYDLFNSLNESIAQDLVAVSQKTVDLSKAYAPGETIQTNRIKNIDKEIANLKAQIDEAISKLPEGVEINEEVSELQTKLQLTENYKDFLVKRHEFGLTQELSEEGRKVLARPDTFIADNEAALNTYANSYIDFLNYLKTNSLYTDVTDVDLVALMKSYFYINGFTEGIAAANWEKAINTYIERTEGDSVGYESMTLGIANDLAVFQDIVSKGDINQIKTAYQNLLQSDGLVNLSDFLGQSADEILAGIIPRISGRTFIDFINEVSDLKSEIKVSPAYELLEKFAVSTNGISQNIVNLIVKEYNSYLNSDSLEDYIINNKDALTRLKETSRFIDILNSLVIASIDGGYNTQINKFKKKLAKDLLAEIDTETAVNMSSDLKAIKVRLDTLINIAENNNAQKIREQKDIAINMRQRFTNLLLNNENSVIKDKFASLFNLDLNQLIAESDFPSGEIKESNFKEFEEASIRLETKIYQLIDDQKLSNSEIVDRITSLFEPTSLITARPTKLARDTEAITDYDQAVYLLSLIAYPSANFYNNLKTVITDESFNKAPIFSQEYAIRLIHATSERKDLFNEFVKYLSAKAKATSDDSYIQNKSQLLNFIATFGGAGTGKTQGVAYVLRKMMPAYKIVTVAPTRKQTDRLSAAIEHDGLSYTKAELIEQILGKQISESDINKIVGSDEIPTYTLKDLKLNPATMFAETENRIIFIDEISQFSKIDLELITRWANKNNILIVGLGDYKQNSAYIFYENARRNLGIEDTYFTRTPNLTAPLRPNNIAKYDNYTILNSILDQTWDKYYDNPSMLESEIDLLTKQILSENSIKLKYFETTETFGGEKFINSSDEVPKIVEKLSKLSNDIAIITDNPAKYTAINNVKVVGLDSVQGDEFEFAIIDKSWKDTSGKHYLTLKDLYTLTQRSTKGTIIVDNGISLDLKLNTINDMTSAGSIEVSPEQISDFKDWRTKLLENSPESIDYEEVNPNPIVAEPVIPTSEQNIKPRVEPTPEAEIVSESPKEPVRQASVEPETKNTVAEAQSKQTFNSNTGEQPPVTDQNPVHAPNVEQSVTPPVDILEEVPQNIGITDNPLNISKWNDIADFYLNNLWNYDQATESSLFNILGIKGKLAAPKYIRALNLIAAYFKYGYYKNPREIVRLGQALNKDRAMGRAFSELETALKTKPIFEVVPYDNGRRGLLVAKIQIKDKTAQIPLLFTTPRFGIYTGDFTIGSYAKFTREGELTTVDVSNFNTSALNKGGLFSSYGKLVSLVVRKSDWQDHIKWVGNTFEADSRNYAFMYQNRGNTFMLFSADPLVSQKEFEAHLKAQVAEDGTILNTVQNDPRIRLIGINSVASLDNIIHTAINNVNLFNAQRKAGDKNVKVRNNLNRERAGQLISLAYFSPYKSTILFRLGALLNTQSGYTNAIRVTYEDKVTQADRGNVTERIVTMENGQYVVNGKTYSDFDSLLNNEFGSFDSNQMLMQTGYISRVGKFEFNDPSFMIYNIFADFVGKTEKLQEHIENNPNFKQGIYVFDDAVKVVPGSQFYYEVDTANKLYSTNASNLIGNDFIIDYDKIQVNPERAIQEDLQRQKINKINEAFKQFGVNKQITNIDLLESTVNDVNNEILNKVTTPNYTIIQIVGDSNNPEIVMKEIKDDLTPMLKNLFKQAYGENPDDVTIISRNNLKFVPFLVSLNNNSKNFVLENKDGVYSIREFNTMNEYIELRDYLNSAKDLYKSSPNILMYLKALMQNTEVTETIASTYYNEVSTNETLNELRENVQKYLIAKLENNEC